MVAAVLFETMETTISLKSADQRAKSATNGDNARSIDLEKIDRFVGGKTNGIGQKKTRDGRGLIITSANLR